MSLSVGLCWPSPGTQYEPLPASLLALVKQTTLATHLRINLHHRKQGVDEMVGDATDAGFTVLPILDFDYGQPDLDAYGQFCYDVVRAHRFPAVELGNEPSILQHMSPMDYAKVFTAGARGVRAAGTPTQIYTAAEVTKPIGNRISFFHEWRQLVLENLWDVLAIHPYRNPMPQAYSPFGSRQSELSYYQSQMPEGKGVAVTEVGWDLRDGVDLDRQAAYVYEELRTSAQLGLDACFIYQHTDPPSNTGFGVFDHEWNARPAAHAMGRFQRERGIA